MIKTSQNWLQNLAKMSMLKLPGCMEDKKKSRSRLGAVLRIPEEMGRSLQCRNVSRRDAVAAPRSRAPLVQVPAKFENMGGAGTEGRDDDRPDSSCSGSEGSEWYAEEHEDEVESEHEMKLEDQVGYIISPLL